MVEEDDELTIERQIADGLTLGGIELARGWISLSRFATLIRVSYPTALKMQKEGKIKTVMVSHTHRIYPDELKRYFRERAQLANLPRPD